MRDPGEEDAGVIVGGDAYGGVKLAGGRRRPRRSARVRRRNAVLAGLLSTGVLIGTGVVWATPRQIGTVDAGGSRRPRRAGRRTSCWWASTSATTSPARSRTS
ncbi:hypothetical protein ACFSTC_49475 [Nonomuraea ferruginea]